VNLPLVVVHPDANPEDRIHPRAPSSFRVDLDRPDLSDLKVLVVDDEPDAQVLICRLLKDCGADVRATGSADEAMQLLSDRPPDVLISDIGMPGVDGYEFLRRVRRHDDGQVARVPAVALTAFARSEDRTRALRAGFLAHVAKPVEPAELIATIAAVTGRVRQYQREP
jgi:CheY-like chemotaxis protein